MILDRKQREGAMMEGLALEAIQAVLDGGPSVKGATGRRGTFAILRNGERVKLGSGVKEQIGYFDSKTGSTKRSRKGRTYKAPNGYARYIPGWNSDILAYKVVQ